ncbi:MAG: hypothetical protein Q9206_001717 [Seirophora lacunosa]
MAFGDPAAPGRAQGRARPTPGQLQTGETHTRNQRFSWLETPLEVQRPTFQQFSSPANSIIDESPISPPDAYQNWHTHQQAHALPSLTEQKAHPERPGSPYNFPAPTETHPAYFAPVVEETQPAQSELRQPVATDTKETLEDVKSSINAPTPKPLSHPRKESAVVLKPDGDGSTLVYNPKSLAGPNAALENHRPGQAAHPNAAVEPEWKHGLSCVELVIGFQLAKPNDQVGISFDENYFNPDHYSHRSSSECPRLQIVRSGHVGRKRFGLSTLALAGAWIETVPVGHIGLKEILAKLLQIYRQDPNFWRFLTRTTFRIPPQPLLQADGARWQWLYRRLRTQTQLYTWGSNGCGNLGHGFGRSDPQSNVAESVDSNGRNIGWPRRVALDDLPEDIGVIADVQCGRLTFPSAYPPTTKHRYESSTAIAQFSSGRMHMLGLADDGKVWQWNSDEARLIKPVHVDVGEGRVTRVVAGWDRASMYISGTGIIYWPDDLPLRFASEEADALLIDTATIPGTSSLHSTTHREGTATLQSRIGQVTNHIALENYVVFTTKLNKVFLYRMDFPLPDLDPPEPIELTAFYPTNTDIPFEVRDLQGSFRSFAIFTVGGDVLIGNRAMLDAFYAASQEAETPSSTAGSPLPPPTVIPALQNNSIVSIAFGDHHFQALRSDGTILAFGNDPQACGALGLGFPTGTGPLRGLMAFGYSSDAVLRENEGREVWFDPTMHRWLADMRAKATTEGEAAARGAMVLSPLGEPEPRTAAITAMGDYFAREGRKWEDGVRQEGEMGGYFVLKAAAAGWHSAALVLVDDDKVERARAMHVVQPPPPPPPATTTEAGGKEEPEQEDWHGDTWEDIDAPWDQLSNAVAWCVDLIWSWGRWFLGLDFAKDTSSSADAEAEKKKKETAQQKRQGDGEGAEMVEDTVRYTWTERPFPRLRMANGEVMPGEVEITE